MKKLIKIKTPYIYEILILLVGIIIIYLKYLNIISTLPFPEGGSLPEYILDFNAAINFKEFGFLKTWFILDYSNSPTISDHPYLYTHQLGFSSIIIAILLKLDYSITQIRMFFVLISFLGIYYLYKISFELLFSISSVPTFSH